MTTARERTLAAFLAAEAKRAEQKQLDGLRAANTLLHAQVKALHKESRASDRIVEYARLAVDALPPVPVPHALPAPSSRRTLESAVLLASCWHIGETINKQEMGGLNEYNFDIFCRRLQSVVTETIAWTQQNMATHTFDELHVIHTGDMVSGIIHDELVETNCLNIVEQATLGAFVTAQALRELAAVFPKVVFTGVVGNHGRTAAKKYFKQKSQVNWDHVAYNYLALLLRDQKNITFRLPLSFWAGVEIKGWNFHIAHGDLLKSSFRIPFYGMARDADRWVEISAGNLGKLFRYFIRSHFHTKATQQTAIGESILNGALKGGCEYALGLPAFGDPLQLLFGVHAKYGKTWELPINAKFARGACRYRYRRDVSLAEQELP